MSNAAKLKKRAFELEQKKQFDKALALYIQALEQGDGDDDADVALYNHVGDLQYRVGKPTESLAYYEKAIDLYAERGFLNNAIALCNKILRQSPGRTTIYYKLGKISAKKGFKSDAKKNFLEYADRMQQVGQIDEAFRALKEFADLCPDQDDIRLMLAEQLSKENRRDEALEQLQMLYTKLETEGRQAEARATIGRMKAIDPEATPRPSGQFTTQKTSDLVFLDVGFDGPAFGRPRTTPPPRQISDPDLVAVELSGLETLDLEAPPSRATPVEGFAPTVLEDGGASGVEDDERERDELPRADALADLPLIDASTPSSAPVVGSLEGLDSLHVPSDGVPTGALPGLEVTAMDADTADSPAGGTAAVASDVLIDLSAPPTSTPGDGVVAIDAASRDVDRAASSLGPPVEDELESVLRTPVARGSEDESGAPSLDDELEPLSSVSPLASILAARTPEASSPAVAAGRQTEEIPADAQPDVGGAAAGATDATEATDEGARDAKVLTAEASVADRAPTPPHGIAAEPDVAVDAEEDGVEWIDLEDEEPIAAPRATTAELEAVAMSEAETHPAVAESSDAPAAERAVVPAHVEPAEGGEAHRVADLRAAIARKPEDWTLRRRIGELLLDSGEL